MKFVADMMLGKLARWLRILGYDVMYDQSLSLKDLVTLSNQTDTIFLTRRRTLPENILPSKFFTISSELFPEQLRGVVTHFNLDMLSNLFTRCIACNVPVQRVAKEAMKGQIPERSYGGFEEFFQCPVCRSIYWDGSHCTKTRTKLQQILLSSESSEGRSLWS
jgi:uncharacterized protein